MFRISLKQIKNCISELESEQRELKKNCNRLEDIYASFDSLTDGKLDKQVLRSVIDEVEKECGSLGTMKKVLSESASLYEKTEAKIVSSAPPRRNFNEIGIQDLRDLSATMQNLGIYFE
ncbi:MAG: hypothetical protein K5739_07770 [Lachnospiraceae bacterium]|nr:hypothetical protein [Lachnospiraceae bacterium]